MNDFHFTKLYYAERKAKLETLEARRTRRKLRLQNEQKYEGVTCYEGAAREF